MEFQRSQMQFKGITLNKFSGNLDYFFVEMPAFFYEMGIMGFLLQFLDEFDQLRNMRKLKFLLNAEDGLTYRFISHIKQI